MEAVQSLIKLQDILLDELNGVSSIIKQEVDTNLSSKLYERKLQALDKLYDKFKENHYLISMADDKDCTKEYLEKHKNIAFEKLYFEIASELDEKIASISQSNNDLILASTHITTPGHTRRSHVKLPPISLPKFDGTYKSWRSFKDLYINLIHSNDEISDIEKLHYLKSCVSGEAARVIKPFDIVGSNYSKAWQELERRFNNNRVLINAQLEKLCRINQVKTESAQSMKDVLSNTEEILHELKTLRVDIDNWDPIIVYLTVQKLAPETRELWEIKQSEKVEVTSFKELKIFLEARFRALEAINVPKRSNVFLTQNNTINNHIVKCPNCSSDHRLFNCTKFKSLSSLDKLKFAKRNKLCMNCFTPKHKYNECKSKYTCSTCKKKHHTLLHTSFSNIMNTKQSISSAQLTHTDTGDQAPPAVNISDRNEIKTFLNSNTNQALLATALVKIRNAQGHTEVLRALIDSGSQATFITASATRRLQLKTTHSNQFISGLSQSSATVADSQSEFVMESLYGNFKLTVNALVVKSITNDLPTYRIETTGFDHLKSLRLADPNYAEPGRIDVLIGAEVYAAIIRKGIRRSKNPNHPVAINTTLGWIVMGNTGHDKLQSSKTFMVQVHEEKSLDELLRKSWEQEENTDVVHQKPEDEKCEAIYQKTTVRLKNGTYQVDLPFKSAYGPDLGESRKKAVSQFLTLERKFKQNTEYYESYRKNMDEYLAAGHMIQLKVNTDELSYYMPHHGVLKESTTTKLRTVFNASSKTTNRLSLNKQLLKGKRNYQRIPDTPIGIRRSELKNRIATATLQPHQPPFESIGSMFHRPSAFKNSESQHTSIPEWLQAPEGIKRLLQGIPIPWQAIYSKKSYRYRMGDVKIRFTKMRDGTMKARFLHKSN